jgi:hypothetical protein
MSKITLAPNASGTAIFTVAAPATSTNRTLTLPDATGTILSNADISSQPQAEAGTNNATVMTPLRVQQNVDLTKTTRFSSNGLTSVVGSRALATAYQNTTGFWMVVSVTCSANGMTFLVGTTSATTITLSTVNQAPNTILGLVPPNYYYKVTGSGLTAWYES